MYAISLLLTWQVPSNSVSENPHSKSFLHSNNLPSSIPRPHGSPSCWAALKNYTLGHNLEISRILWYFLACRYVSWSLPESNWWASSASFGQTLCLPNAPPAMGFSLFSSTNLSCSSQVIVSKQHGIAWAPNPYRKQHTDDDGDCAIRLNIYLCFEIVEKL